MTEANSRLMAASRRQYSKVRLQISGLNSSTGRHSRAPARRSSSWASRFREQKTTRSAGSKGGPRVTEYAYTVSLAVALGEGPVTSVQRAWANGEAFDLSQMTYRFYAGDEAQEADPLVGMIEGGAPAYRGMAYVVFEDLPLDGFGNRIPQLSFEIVRVPPGAAPLCGGEPELEEPGWAS